MSGRFSSEAARNAVLGSPLVAVTAATFAGLPLETWLMGATLFYTILLILHLLWRWARDLREGGEGD